MTCFSHSMATRHACGVLFLAVRVRKRDVVALPGALITGRGCFRERKESTGVRMQLLLCDAADC